MKDYSQYKLAAKRDFHDYRDILKVAAPAPVPEKAQVRYLPPIKDQQKFGSCVGHGIAGFMEQVLTSRGMNVSLTLAPLYIWYFARLEEHSEKLDEGVQLRSGMKALLERGICPEEFWPHSSPIDAEPNMNAEAYGKALTIPEYQRCATVQEIKYSIAVEDQSVVIGLPVFKNWYSDLSVKTGRIDYTGSGVPLGGHALYVVGYDDHTQIGQNSPGAVKIANSWGVDYGDNGFIYLPYDYLDAEQFDAFTAGYESLPAPS